MTELTSFLKKELKKVNSNYSEIRDDNLPNLIKQGTYLLNIIKEHCKIEIYIPNLKWEAKLRQKNIYHLRMKINEEDDNNIKCVKKLYSLVVANDLIYIEKTDFKDLGLTSITLGDEKYDIEIIENHIILNNGKKYICKIYDNYHTSCRMDEKLYKYNIFLKPEFSKKLRGTNIYFLLFAYDVKKLVKEF